jgi:sec-independent protein translocase protein TatA
MPFGIGIWELLILLLVLLLVFGPKRLPEMGRQLGKGMREFKDSVTGVEEAVDTTTPTPKPVEQLPAATSEPDAPASASEAEAEREPVR